MQNAADAGVIDAGGIDADLTETTSQLKRGRAPTTHRVAPRQATIQDAEVVIIGAGVAGLVAGAFLARDGRDVIVLEQGAVPGGCVSGFERKGFHFDGGAQSFENLGLLFPLLDELGGLTEALDVEQATYKLRTPTVDCPMSWEYEDIAEAFCTAHPESAADLRRFFREVFGVSRTIEQVIKPGRNPEFTEGFAKFMNVARLCLSSPLAVAKVVKARQLYASEVASRTLSEPGLSSLLGSFGYRDTTLTALSGFFACWRNDYWRPRGGARRLPELLVQSLETHGGRLRCRAGVKKILSQNNRVTGVLLENDEVINVRTLIAACDHTHLERQLLGLKTPEPTPDDVSDAFFTLYLGLDIDDQELDRILPEQHTFFFPEHRDCRLNPADPIAHKDRWIEVTRASHNGLDQAPEGCSSLTVQTMTRADWGSWWGLDEDRRRRTPQYRELKEQVEEELLDSLERFLPGIGSHICLRFSATPHTYTRYTRNHHGATAGWSWDPARVAAINQRRDDGIPLALHTALDGLYRCGHWTASVGKGSIPFAAFSGFSAYQALLKDGR